MLMQPVRIDQILADLKDMTRRPAKEDDQALHDESGAVVAVKRNGRMLWHVGGTYALCPHRGKPVETWDYITDENETVRITVPRSSFAAKPLRIRITGIKREDARSISAADARREGFEKIIDFLQVWMGFYDRSALSHLQDSVNILWHGGQISDNESSERAQAFLVSRPAALYDCWAISFRIVE